jgi:hypothetical protein
MQHLKLQAAHLSSTNCATVGIVKEQRGIRDLVNAVRDAADNFGGSGRLINVVTQIATSGVGRL